MMEDEKDGLAGEYRKLPVLAGCHIFAPVGYIKRYMEDAVFRFLKTSQVVTIKYKPLRLQMRPIKKTFEA